MNSKPEINSVADLVQAILDKGWAHEDKARAAGPRGSDDDTAQYEAMVSECIDLAEEFLAPDLPAAKRTPRDRAEIAYNYAAHRAIETDPFSAGSDEPAPFGTLRLEAQQYWLTLSAVAAGEQL
jgi:hypothetical protein